MKKLSLCIISLCLTACVSNTYLAKQQYMLHANKPLFKAEKPLAASLTVEPTLASPPYDNVQFIYRLKDSQYLNDYYNIFMTQPATQVSTGLTQFLQETNLFSTVNSADMTLASNYNLKTQLTALYANYSKDTRPTAVMEIQFILLDTNNNIVYHTLVSAHAPLATKSTEALIKAWNKDLTIIFTKFSVSLANQLHASLVNSTPTQMPSPAMTTQTTSSNNFLSLPGSTQPAATAAPATKPAQTTSDNSEAHGFLRLY